jgi:hypothetical protein
MRRWLVAVFLMVPGLALGQSAPGGAAPQPTSAQKFAAVMQNAGHRQAVLSDAELTPAWVALGCKTASFAEAPEVAVYAPVKFDVSGAPLAGEWREGVVATGCGQRMQLNVLTEVTGPSTLASGALLPGATITDPVLQNAAQAYAVRAAGGLPAGCKDAFVANTAFLGFLDGQKGMPQGPITTPWREDWVLYFCGGLKVVRLQFSPGVAGISVAVMGVR